MCRRNAFLVVVFGGHMGGKDVGKHHTKEIGGCGMKKLIGVNTPLNFFKVSVCTTKTQQTTRIKKCEMPFIEG